MTKTLELDDAIAAAFREPFPPEVIKQRDGRGGMRFDYIDARDVENRLDEVVGPAGWSDEYEVIDPERLGIKCRLTVLGVYKEGIGYPNNPLGATNRKGERVDSDEPGKDAESDALKRAAVKFGIGRHLYEDKPAARPRSVQTAQPGGNVVDIRSPKTLLKGLAVELAKKTGKSDKQVLRDAAERVGVTFTTIDALSDEDTVKVGKDLRSQLQIRENSEQPAETGQYF